MFGGDALLAADLWVRRCLLIVSVCTLSLKRITFRRSTGQRIRRISGFIKHFHQIPSVPRDETRNASSRSASIRDRIAAGASKASSTKTRSPVLRSASTSSKPCVPHRHHVPASERYVGTITSTFTIASERHWRRFKQFVLCTSARRLQ